MRYYPLPKAKESLPLFPFQKNGQVMTVNHSNDGYQALAWRGFLPLLTDPSTLLNRFRTKDKISHLPPYEK